MSMLEDEGLIHKCKEYEELRDRSDRWGNDVGFFWYEGTSIEKWEMQNPNEVIWIMANGEYENEIRFCPFCGKSLFDDVK